MKKLKLSAILISAAALTSCCHCKEDYPFLRVNFENFSTAEIKTIYLVSDGLADTCFACVDTLSGIMFIPALPYSQHKILSDSLAINKLVQVNKINTESSRFFLCDPCTEIKSIDYELDGINYTNEPVVITR